MDHHPDGMAVEEYEALPEEVSPQLGPGVGSHTYVLVGRTLASSR